MKIGIVIPAMNLWDSYTKPCIDSVKTKHDYRIVLVDNGSSDNTSEEAGKLVSNNFAHHRNDVNLGCQAAWNYGIKDSFEKSCDYVLIINNDILLHKDAIDRLVERFENSKTTNVPIAEPLASTLSELTPDTPPRTQRLESEILGMVTCMDIRGELPVPSMINVLDPDFKKDCPEAEHPNFSAFMINKLCWDTIGEVDELFFPAYFEDNDYHYRLKTAGIKAIVYPPAMFYHYGSRTQNEATKIPVVTGSLFEGNRTKYAEKWGGVPGSERFVTPYNDQSKTIKSVMQCP